jgi:hypothetical protein
MVHQASCAGLIRFEEPVVDRVVDRMAFAGTVADLDRSPRLRGIAR